MLGNFTNLKEELIHQLRKKKVKDRTRLGMLSLGLYKAEITENTKLKVKNQRSCHNF